MTKEDIFKQLDKMPNDLTRAEFISHLYELGTITGAQAISYSKEYNERKAKR
jgi:Mor family transcriptional regulator